LQRSNDDSPDEARTQRQAKQRERSAQALETADLLANLGSRTARGGVVAVAGQFISILIQVLSLAIMSRLLQPEDFGLMAMSLAITGFAAVFADLGFSTATIQRQELSQNIVSTLFFLNVGTGVLIMLAVWALAPLAAHLLNDPRVLWIIVAMAVTLPISSLSAQHLALLSRRMRWVTLRWITIASQVLGLIVGALLAWRTEAGYWALVASAWATAVASTALAWAVSPWRPGRVEDWKAAREAVHFGLHLMGAQVIFWAARQLDNLLVGARWGPAELGQYSRAYTLYMLPVKFITGPVTSAVIPALSRLQNRPDAWRRSLLDVQGALFLGAGSVCAVLIATSDLIIQVLLGPQWQDSVPLFQILSLSIPLMMVSNTNGFIQISLGRSDRMLKWNLVRLPILIAGFLIGLPYGARGVAIAVTAVAFVLWLPGIAYAAHDTPVSMRMILRRTAAPLLCIAIAATITLLLPMHSGWPLVDLIAKAVFCVALYFCAAALTLAYDSAFASLKTRVLGVWKSKRL